MAWQPTGIDSFWIKPWRLIDSGARLCILFVYSQYTKVRYAL